MAPFGRRVSPYTEAHPARQARSEAGSQFRLCVRVTGALLLKDHGAGPEFLVMLLHDDLGDADSSSCVIP